MSGFKYRTLLTIIPDDPEIYDGAHVAIQVVGRRLQEEKVLALAEHVSEALAASS